jgi:cell division protein FtsZ
VRDFASDDATVVVGTVIDPELHGELRVTLVATGLDSRDRIVQPTATVTPLQRTSSGEVDYSHLERPAVIRKQAVAPGVRAEPVGPGLDYLDIPAFLRRQAD